MYIVLLLKIIHLVGVANCRIIALPHLFILNIEYFVAEKFTMVIFSFLLFFILLQKEELI